MSELYVDEANMSGHARYSRAPAELRARMRRPQRHRLLHGYPLAGAMPEISSERDRSRILPCFDPSRGLLVGVLPHSFCNPAVAGCGFCTFPHEAFSSKKASATVETVCCEIDQTIQARPDLERRPIAGLYFGGGTANLSPPEPFRNLCRTIARAFDVSGAEVTLEGVPAAFLSRRPRLVDILLAELPARHFRLSMGIQTFDKDRLKRMGRVGFGDAETFLEVVRFARSRGFTASGDLLFNLPGQALDRMIDDVRAAVEIGLDHIGLYHLVLFAGLGTAWSRDPELLATLPSNAEAAENLIALRELLRDLGFVQTTLTNFERREYRGLERRFVYEELSYRPDLYDMLGFGPAGISYAYADGRAAKVVNPETASEYVARVDRGGPAWDRAFEYDSHDLRVLHLTRRLAALRIERGAYRDFFGTGPLDDFRPEFYAIEQEGLMTVNDETIEPTPRGIFYADSIAGLLARSSRVQRRVQDRGNAHHHM
ncbi:MAG: radical SAM protein [Isosphaeraceae bacterium]|nr:radical SAM protein [Isosphaeraceae bacterium]